MATQTPEERLQTIAARQQAINIVTNRTAPGQSIVVEAKKLADFVAAGATLEDRSIRLQALNTVGTRVTDVADLVPAATEVYEFVVKL